MKINRKNPTHWAYLIWIGFLVILFLPFRKLRKSSPTKTVVLYGHKLHGNINALYQFAQRNQTALANLQVFFLTMDPKYHCEIKENSNILFALNPIDMKQVVLADCIITDHGLHTLQLLLLLTDIFFVDVWHGIPFKGFIANDFTTQHQYDEVWVSSNLLKKLYIDKFGFNKDRVHVTGYGRTDLILDYHASRLKIKEKLNIPTGKKVILFAPTWKQDTSNRKEIPFDLSQENFLNTLENFALNNNAVLIIRYHLNSTQRENLNTRNVLHLPLQMHPNSEEIIGVTDVLVTDWSSIAFDMMALDKPIIFLDVPPPFINGFSLPAEFRAGDIVTNLAELLESLTRHCSAKDEYPGAYDQEYERIKKLVYDDTVDGKSTSRYFTKLKELL